MHCWDAFMDYSQELSELMYFLKQDGGNLGFPLSQRLIKSCFFSNLIMKKDVITTG